MDESKGKIEPAGPLMKEHRLIERMIKLIVKEIQTSEKTKRPDLEFIADAADFIKMYADRRHHGKEEDILFRDLKKKEISDEHKSTMQNLFKDHVFGRETVKSLLEAKGKYENRNKDAQKEIMRRLKDLAALYPGHIEAEDQRFFLPCMDYFDRDEQDKMLEEMEEFDGKLEQKDYRKVVEKWEKEKK